MASAALQSAGLYRPAQGPLDFNGTGRQGQNTYGPIMQAIRDNNPINLNVNSVLAQANADISAFDGHGQNFSSYQQIMTNLCSTTNTAKAVAALQAFEHVIMHLYNYKAYFGGSYNSISSMFVTGIRQSWFDLRCYGPKSWISDNDPELKQLIDELEGVASVMERHNTTESARLNMMIHSYRHWRRNMALTVAAYLIADACKHGVDKSIVSQFYQGGLTSTPGILCNVGSDMVAGGKVVAKGVATVANFGWKYAVKPVGEFIGGGKNGFSPAAAKAEVAVIPLNEPVEPVSDISSKKDIMPRLVQKNSNIVQSPAQVIAGGILSVVISMKDMVVGVGKTTARGVVRHIKDSDDITPEQTLTEAENVVNQSLKYDAYKNFDKAKSQGVMNFIRSNILDGIEQEHREAVVMDKFYRDELTAEQKAYDMDDNNLQKQAVSLMAYIQLLESFNAELSFEKYKQKFSFGAKVDQFCKNLKQSAQQQSWKDVLQEGYHF